MSVVEKVKSTTAEYALPKLDKIFSLLGVPNELKSDYSPPFNGIKFSEFVMHRELNLLI